MSDIHFCIDLETAGVSPNTMILTIGVLAFDPPSGKILGEPFYERISIDSYRQYTPSFSLDGDTISWWMTQSEEARLEAFCGERKELSDVLLAFIEWCRVISNGKKIFIWSHGASFDVPIVSYALTTLGLEIPWKFWNIRDTRTLFDMVSLDFRTIGQVPVNNHMYPNHHALGDCAKEIEGIKQSYQRLKRK